ncbi:MAG TPA: hypothetical protein HPP80_05240 [Rhodospirillaceae bacterium]|nr:hypothetical protein [Rhodospirillaceae bacterium]
MVNSAILTAALSNLIKSYEFLEKLTDACEKLPMGEDPQQDLQALAAIALLTSQTEAVISTIRRAQTDGIAFSARDSLLKALGAETVPLETTTADQKVTRLQVIVDMCLSQTSFHREAAAQLRGEVLQMREQLRMISAELQQSQAALADGAVATEQTNRKTARRAALG